MSRPRSDPLEELVRKSLKVNPRLRAGKTTSEIVTSMNEERAAHRRAAEALDGDAANHASVQQRLDSFLARKAQEFERVDKGLRAQEERLREQRSLMQQRITDELVRFMARAYRGDEPGLEALTKHAEVLQALGLSEKQLRRTLRRFQDLG